MGRKRPRRLVLRNPEHTSTLTFNDPKHFDHINIAFSKGKMRPLTLVLGPRHAAELAMSILDWLPHMKPSHSGH